ncbi:armadillo-type protein [Mycotypha africana]|uniref:armadillo-type protein n=1 Tax=Mycotypha africana TaxID=64632 RepID=UPI0023013083|nr:armadillo-type protein [Mycotypha africana]KAI8968919.1 armadillo-type protein [Mycotypha africana]
MHESDLMRTWQPEQQGLRELIYLFTEANKVINSDLGMISQRIYTFNEHPDFNLHLVYILTKLKNEQHNIRLSAGRLLNNNIQNDFNNIPLRVLSYIKKCCTDIILCPSNEDEEIYQSVSFIIATVVRYGQPHNWPEIFQTLIDKLGSSDKFTLRTSIRTLAIICEHVASELDFEVTEGVRPLNRLIRKFIEFYTHSDATIRTQAIYMTSQFILSKPVSLLEQLEDILQVLYKMAADETNTPVRRELGRILSALLEAFPQKMVPYVKQTITFMINALSDPDEETQLTACGFWVQYAQSNYFRNELVSYLPQLVESLLKLMVYSEADLILSTTNTVDRQLLQLSNDRSTSTVSDDTTRIVETSSGQEESIQPTTRFYRNRIEAQEPSKDSTTNRNESLSDFDEEESDSSSEEVLDKEGDEKQDNEQESDNEVEDNLVDNFEDEEFYSDYTLRKYSAAALDVLSVSFKDDIAKVTLDLLQSRLFVSDNWFIRESGILALGAIAEGGINIISEQLYCLIPYLLMSTKDGNPLIRSISCWALSRFSSWLIHQYDDTNAESRSSTTFFESVLYGLLERITDSNKRVQESACTAFVIIGEAASFRLIPYIKAALIQTNIAFSLYGRKNRLILYDALGTLADAVGSELNRPDYINLLMPPLINKWNELSDHDTDLFPLLECLSNITAALGSGFKQYVEPVLSRCVKLISSTLQKQLLADQFPEEVYPPNVEFLIAALDLLSGIVQGLGSEINPLIAQTDPPLLPLLITCIHDPVPEVLQSTFALIGDIASASLSLLLPFIHGIVTEMIHILCNADNIMPVSVYNNVLWALGEIIMRWGNNVHPDIPSLLNAFLRFLTHPQAPPSIHENAMIALGRLGYACPGAVAPYLKYFIKPWLEKSLSVRDGEEKDSAFIGLCLMIKLSVQDARPELCLLLHAVSILKAPSITLSKELVDVIKWYHDFIPTDEWEDANSRLEPEVRNVISQLLVKADLHSNT